jgi:hypothetical protein
MANGLDREEIFIVVLIAMIGAIGVAIGVASNDRVLEATIGGAMLLFGGRAAWRALGARQR